MQEEENQYGSNLEHLMHLICAQYPHAVYLRTDTFDIRENKNGVWQIKKSKLNGNTESAYLENAYIHMINSNVNNNSVIFTILGLNLGEGGHYGGILCDVAKKKVFVFDSMSGQYEDDYYNSGTERLFLAMAKKIFNYPKTKKLLGGKLEFENVYVDYILQPTGGFEDIISPSIEKYSLDAKLQRLLNIQHTDSQNHFCYIWSIWFCHLYLSGGGIESFETVLNDALAKKLIPLVIIKKYILGFTHLLGKIDNANFFYYHFPRLWSNHLYPTKIKFNVFKFSYKNAKSVESALQYSIDMSKYGALKQIAHTKSDQVKTYLECFSFENELEKLGKNIGNLRISDKSKKNAAATNEIPVIDISV